MPPADTRRIALAMITKDSMAVIDRCLDSAAAYVDEICVYDTGSQDGTVEHLESRGVTVARGEWRDDFSWARERSFELVSPETEWILWLDDDDVLVGGEHLRRLVATTAPNDEGLALLYDYTRNAHGQTVLQLWRERVVRRDGTLRWRGVVHEALRHDDEQPVRLRPVPPDTARVVHIRPSGRYDPGRNLMLLEHERDRASEAGRPVDTHTLVYLAAEHMARERYEKAIPFLEEYLARPVAWPEQRAQIHHRLALCRLHTGDPEAAAAIELASLDELPNWPETASGLTQAYAALGRWDEVERWATRTLELGLPPSELPVNPAEFTFLPLIHLSEACFRQGRPDEGQEWLARAWATRGATS